MNAPVGHTVGCFLNPAAPFDIVIDDLLYRFYPAAFGATRT